jgi:hypothetical protein
LNLTQSSTVAEVRDVEEAGKEPREELRPGNFKKWTDSGAKYPEQGRKRRVKERSRILSSKQDGKEGSQI